MYPGPHHQVAVDEPDGGGEHMGVFYRKDRLKVIESGDFWLSDTPDVAGSITWTAGPHTETVDIIVKGAIEPPTEWWRLTHPAELVGD